MSLHRITFAGRSFSALAAAAVWITAVGPAAPLVRAQEPNHEAEKKAEAQADPRAQAVIREVAQAYKALSSYSDDGRFALELTIDGKAQKQEQTLQLSFTRPNKLNFDAGIVQVVSDGQTLTTAVAPLKKYTQAPAPEKITFETFREGPLGSILFGGPSAGPMFVLTNLLTGDDAAGDLGKLGGVLKQVDSTDPNSITLLIDKPDGADFRLVVDSKTKLLSAVDVLIDAESLARNFKDEKKVSIGKFGWTSGEISTEANKDPRFAFAPLKGFTKVDSFQADGDEGGEEQYAVNEKVGKPAPDFALTVLDGPGKTKTLSKKDLAGKVVLIDFWATWCPPCMKELPEIQKLAENYAKAKRDVVVVALSQDDESKDPVEVRKLIESTLSKQKIEPKSLIGMDPTKSIGEAFAIEGLPTVVILDGEGVVQAAHVGYNPEILKTLTKNIDALLEGKSLLTEKKPDSEKKPASEQPSK